MDDDKSCEGTLKNNTENKQSGDRTGCRCMLRNCGYARSEKLACAVFRVFSRVEECSEVRRFSQLCNYCFYAVVILYCCVVSEPGQQRHQSY